MSPDEAQESAQRDQLWASLRALRPEIDRLGQGEFRDDEVQRQTIVVLARIIAAEMDFRQRTADET